MGMIRTMRWQLLVLLLGSMVTTQLRGYIIDEVPQYAGYLCGTLGMITSYRSLFHNAVPVADSFSGDAALLGVFGSAFFGGLSATIGLAQLLACMRPPAMADRETHHAYAKSAYIRLLSGISVAAMGAFTYEVLKGDEYVSEACFSVINKLLFRLITDNNVLFGICGLHAARGAWHLLSAVYRDLCPPRVEEYDHRGEHPQNLAAMASGYKRIVQSAIGCAAICMYRDMIQNCV